MMHVAPGVRERTVSSAIYVDFRRIMEALRLLLIASSNICAVLDSRAELRDESSSSPLLMSSLNFATISLSSSRVKKSMFGVAPKSWIVLRSYFLRKQVFPRSAWCRTLQKLHWPRCSWISTNVRFDSFNCKWLLLHREISFFPPRTSLGRGLAIEHL